MHWLLQDMGSQPVRVTSGTASANQKQWHTSVNRSVISAFGRLRREDDEFKASPELHSKPDSKVGQAGNSPKRAGPSHSRN